MKHWLTTLVILLIAKSFAQTTNANSFSKTSQRPAKAQWFSNDLTDSVNDAATQKSQDQARQQKIRWELDVDSDSPSINEMELPGTPQEQKRAVLAELEYLAAQSGIGFQERLDWAKRQGIAHPQEALLLQVNKKLDRMNFKASVDYIEQLPANLRKELISGSVNRTFRFGDLESFKRLVDHKDSMDPSHYYGALEGALYSIPKWALQEKNLGMLEKLIRDVESNQFEDTETVTCKLWFGILSVEDQLSEMKDNTAVSPSAASRKLQLAFLKPLIKRQKISKIHCDAAKPDVDKYAQKLVQENRLTLADYTELKSSLLTQAPPSSSSAPVGHITDAKSCGLNELQSYLRNTFLDLEAKRPSRVSKIMTQTSKKCDVQIRFIKQSGKKENSFRAQITIRNSYNQKLLDLKQDFKDSNALITYLATGKLPDPPVSKVRVLTNLPQISRPASTSLQ